LLDQKPKRHGFVKADTSQAHHLAHREPGKELRKDALLFPVF